MSEGDTVFLKARSHLSKWQIAYIKWICLCSAAVLGYLHSELKGYASFSDITLIQYVEMCLWSLGLVSTTTIAFLDKSKANGDEEDKKPVDFTTINK